MGAESKKNIRIVNNLTQKKLEFDNMFQCTYSINHNRSNNMFELNCTTLEYTPKQEIINRITIFQKLLIDNNIDGAIIIQKADLYYPESVT